jgi:regulatory protein
MIGEYPPARRSPGRRARGGRAEYTKQADTESAAYPGSGLPGSAASGWLAEYVASATREDPEARARQVCLRLLTLAPRTRAQLADALRQRGIPDDVAEGVLGRFAGAGLIDDAAFARAWVDSRHYGRGLSGRALTAELRQRGVDEDQIKEAVDELGPDAEARTARLLVERKLAATAGQAPEARVRRLSGMLARKGYPPGLAFRVIREALEAEGMETGSIETAGPEALLGEEPPVDDLDS